eukprot:1487285-Amphidinium_carterae.3
MESRRLGQHCPRQLRRPVIPLQPPMSISVSAKRSVDRQDGGAGVKRLLNTVSLDESPAEVLTRESLDNLAAALEKLRKKETCRYPSFPHIT